MASVLYPRRRQTVLRVSVVCSETDLGQDRSQTKKIGLGLGLGLARCGLGLGLAGLVLYCETLSFTLAVTMILKVYFSYLYIVLGTSLLWRSLT